MQKREEELRERISTLGIVVDRIREKFVKQNRLNKLAKSDSSLIIDFLQEYQSYMHIPNDVDAVKLLRRADRIEYNLNNL